MHIDNEHVWIFIKFSQNFVPDGPINNVPALVQILIGPSQQKAIIWINDG